LQKAATTVASKLLLLLHVPVTQLLHAAAAAALMCADWRLDVDSMAQTSQLQQLAQAILDRTNATNRAILMGHSFGALVAAKLLQRADVWVNIRTACCRVQDQ
jgi:pimeloyl-ACP methyl ester carboxylesterase